MPTAQTTATLPAYARAAIGRKMIFACLLALGLPTAAWSTPILGAAQAFTVLGGTTVTSTGASVVYGDVGVAPGTAVTGLASAPGSGAAAALAHTDAIAAADYLSSLSSTRDLTGLDLGGMTLTPGVYLLTSSAQLTGTLILDAENLADALFVFQIGTTLTTASGAAVTVINGTSGTGVFFDVGTSATLGAGSLFAGNIVAADSITFTSGASLLCGRALALNGAVTLDTNALSNDCGAGDFHSAGYSGVAATMQDVPEPATTLLVPLGLMALAWGRKRRGRRG